MNTEMWENKINKKNISFLKTVGVDFIGPKIGNIVLYDNIVSTNSLFRILNDDIVIFFGFLKIV